MLKLSRCSHRTDLMLRFRTWDCRKYHKTGLALLPLPQAQASYLMCSSAQSSHGMIPDMALVQDLPVRKMTEEQLSISFLITDDFLMFASFIFTCCGIPFSVTWFSGLIDQLVSPLSKLEWLAI